MQDAKAEPPSTAPKPTIPRSPAHFEFVAGHDSVRRIRRHVAKTNWKRKKEQEALPKKTAPAGPRRIACNPIPDRLSNQPHQKDETESAKDNIMPHLGDEQFAFLSPEDTLRPLEGFGTVSGNSVDSSFSVPTQSDNTISPYHALNGGDLDPFNTTLVLSKADQQFLHHWVHEYAYKAFGFPTDPTFNSLGNVHVPIDISHQAYVHVILAHAASHIAYLRGESTSIEALDHRMNAIHLVNQALEKPETAVTDEIIMAVWGLLTYERYWGTEEVWLSHRRGLNHMVKLRGGLSTFSNDWQLETRVHLVALMQRPRWKNPVFSSPSSVSDLPDHLAHNSDQLHSDFTNFFSDIYSVTPDIAQAYPAINRATLFLQSRARSSEDLVAPGTVDLQEINRLMCLFYIATIVKGANRSHFNLLWLNNSLERTEQVWSDSVDILRWLLVQGVGRGRGGLNDVERIEKLKEIALLLNNSSHRSIDDRMINVLNDGSDEDPFLPCE